MNEMRIEKKYTQIQNIIHRQVFVKVSSELLEVVRGFMCESVVTWFYGV